MHAELRPATALRPGNPSSSFNRLKGGQAFVALMAGRFLIRSNRHHVAVGSATDRPKRFGASQTSRRRTGVRSMTTVATLDTRTTLATATELPPAPEYSL